MLVQEMCVVVEGAVDDVNSRQKISFDVAKRNLSSDVSRVF
jgi:hypothetical protein